MKLLVQHLSIRVPWHDTAWTGLICQKAVENDACLTLPNVSANRNDAQEHADAGKDWGELPPNRLPPCLRERSGFMRPTPTGFRITHPYKETGSGAHTGLEPLNLEIPPWSAPCIPFRWMRREHAEEIAESTGVDYRPDLEAEADQQIPFESGWVQHGVNQRAMIDGFFSAIQEPSLCFFYAKRTPLAEDERRVIIGAARVHHVSPPVEYPGHNPLRTLAWESMVQHTARAGSEGGFLMPYHEALRHANEDLTFDPGSVVAFAPDDGWIQYSYGSEHVSHDVAISSLVACEAALRVAQVHLPGSQQQALDWISARLGELWKLRGPCPGLGSALQAFGVERGTLVVHKIAPLLSEGSDPWELIERAMEDPHAVLPGLQADLGRNLRKKWKEMPAERRSLLRLLSRFALTPDQAERWYQPSVRGQCGIDLDDAAILSNPYILYEGDRRQAEPISVLSVDHGAFPNDVVAHEHPLPMPSAMEDGLDVRRARALMIAELEAASEAGHTLQTEDYVINGVRQQPLDPKCPLDRDQLGAYGDELSPAIESLVLEDGTRALQLAECSANAAWIRRFVERRTAAPKHSTEVDWASLLQAALGTQGEDEADEQRARKEKATALEELYGGRFSVLVGPAGTGKTTLLKVLCDEPSVAGSGVLLLAPTGKARVRLAQTLKRPAMTLAQFLLRSGRYVPDTGEYRRSDGAKEDGFATVIIDEASMLTDAQLAAAIDAVKGVVRFVLVGDFRQLPPIGAGRPFVDIVHRLSPEDMETRFPRVADGIAELTVPRRQTEVDSVTTNQAQRRADLMLAEWFSGRRPSPGADEIWQRLGSGVVDPTLQILRWDGPEDLEQRLLEVLVDDLELAGPDDVLGFEAACGGEEFEGGGKAFFWRGREPETGAASRIEDWQILSPVRGRAHGVRELNRLLHLRFREATREWANDRSRKIPKPFGPEQIVYGDKVISSKNETYRRVYPKEGAERYIANGDIGVAVGQWQSKGMKNKPWKLEVEFSSQLGYSYDYFSGDFGDQNSAPLELAYALTVHRAQGSEFGKTVVVIPEPCRLLSRELLYTALTRQRKRVTILYQGDPAALKKYAEPELSETAHRLTNLFGVPKPVSARDGRFLEAGLLHTTSKGDVVRSKSEVLIAEMLIARGVEYAYERRLAFADGSFRYPDFTIEDDDTGQTIYWEHLGMLADPVYAERWTKKKAWYKAHGVFEATPERPDGGPAGMLVCTVDDERGGFDAQAIAGLMDQTFV